ncbi:MAG: hypothetical protein RSE00_04970 [Clostridia bacterium]
MKDKDRSDDISGIVIDLTTENTLKYRTNTIIKSDFTIEMLEKLGFKWPKVTSKYLIKYFEYLKQIGFIEF